MLIQKLRLQRGWSQEQLAEISGLSARTIQRLERGQPASLETLKALGAVFDVDFSTLKGPATPMSVSPADTSSPPPVTPTPPIPDVISRAPLTAEQEEALAFARVRALKSFYIHLMQYVVIMGGLLILNLVTSPAYLWVIWPVLGWGIGLAFHGLRVFDAIPLLTGDWERRAVERRLGRKL